MDTLNTLDVLDNLVEQFKEVKNWKKYIALVSALLAAVGAVFSAGGLLIPSMWWVFLIIGAVLVIAGVLFFIISRNKINKTEQSVIELLKSDKIPESRREKAKAELGLKF